MLYEEDDVTIVNTLIRDLADTKIKKFEELIDAASQSNNEGQTSFLAGGIDALTACEQMIEDAINSLKAKREIE